MSNVERRVLVAVTLCLFVLAFGLTVQKLAGTPQSHEEEITSSTTLGEGAEAVVHFLLGDGQIAKTEIGTVSADLVGKGIVEVQTAKPEWKIISFSSERIVVSRLCPEVDESKGFLQSAGSYVGIYAGDPEGCHRLVEMTQIPVDNLPPPVRAVLVEGVPFDDPGDLPQLMDGLMGTR